jgi:hypothetical protein
MSTMTLVSALAACGSGSGDQPTAGRGGSAATFSETQGSRVVEAVALHASLPFSGGAAAGTVRESHELVTIDGLIDTVAGAGSKLRPPAGSRLVAVRVSIENVGRPAYRDDPGHEVLLVSDSTGAYVGTPVAYRARAPGCRRSLMRPIELPGGRSVTGCVFFRLPSPQHVAAVQYRTQGGAGGNQATWAVNRFTVHG